MMVLGPIRFRARDFRVLGGVDSKLQCLRSLEEATGLRVLRVRVTVTITLYKPYSSIWGLSGSTPSVFHGPKFEA